MKHLYELFSDLSFMGVIAGIAGILFTIVWGYCAIQAQIGLSDAMDRLRKEKNNATQR